MSTTPPQGGMGQSWFVLDFEAAWQGTPPPQGGLGQSWFVLEFQAAYAGDTPPPAPQPYPVEPEYPASRGPITLVHEDRFPGEFLAFAKREDRVPASFLAVSVDRTTANFSTHRTNEDRITGGFSTSIELAIARREDEDILLLI